MDNRVTIVLLAFLIFGPASKSSADRYFSRSANSPFPKRTRAWESTQSTSTPWITKPSASMTKRRANRQKVAGRQEGTVLHLDSAMVRDGKIYAAHSNYPDWPMTSSLEIFDAETM